MSNGFRYTGSGDHPRGVPARDISQDQFEQMSPLEKRRVAESGMFQPAKATKAPDPKTDEKGVNDGN